MSLFGKMHSVQLRVSQPGFSFENMLQVGNLVPDSCEMADGVEGFLELPLGLSAQRYPSQVDLRDGWIISRSPTAPQCSCLETVRVRSPIPARETTSMYRIAQIQTYVESPSSTRASWPEHLQRQTSVRQTLTHHWPSWRDMYTASSPYSSSFSAKAASAFSGTKPKRAQNGAVP